MCLHTGPLLGAIVIKETSKFYLRVFTTFKCFKINITIRNLQRIEQLHILHLHIGSLLIFMLDFAATCKQVQGAKLLLSMSQLIDFSR